MLSDQYISGFFDGEGTIYLEKTKKLWRLSICQSERDVLEEIKETFGCGYIHSRKKWAKNNHLGKKEIFVYCVNYQKDLIEVIKRILPHSIVKRKKLVDALDFLSNREWHWNWKLKSLKREQLMDMYCEKKMSIKQIADILGVSYNAVHNQMCNKNIERRTHSEAMRAKHMNRKKQRDKP